MVAIDTPERQAERRALLDRELANAAPRSVRGDRRCRPGPPAGRRMGPRPTSSDSPPDLVVEIRATPAGVRLVDRATGRDVTASSRAELAAVVVELLEAARRTA